MNRKLKQLVGILAAWRLGLFLVGASAGLFLKYQPSFPYSDSLQLFNLPQWLYSWANFDGVHYLSLIKAGVHTGYKEINFIQAFFPLFPLLAQGVNFFVNNPLVSALLVSHLSFLGMVWLFFKLTTAEYSQKFALQSLIVLLLFPTSFFFVGVYGEALFLCFVLASFLAARSQRWWLAGVLGALASATRIVGIALIPALLVELWLQKKVPKQTTLQFFTKNLWPIVCISGAVLGLLSYMVYLWSEFSDPLYFLHVQSEFGGGRSESIILYPQVIWRYLKIIVTARPFDWKYFAYMQEFVAGTLGLLGLVFAYKKVRSPYLVFALLAFFIPTLTGTFSSMSRYLLVCFPLFWYIANSLTRIKKRWVLYLAISALLLIMNTMLFIQGYWVA